MIQLFSHRWFRSLVFTLVIALMSWFFGFQSFSNFFSMDWLELSLIAFIAGLVYYLIEWIRVKKLFNSLFSESVSFLIATTITSIIVALLFNVAVVYYIAFFAGFFILGFVLTAFHYLVNLMQDIQLVGTVSKNEIIGDSQTQHFILENTKGKAVFDLPFESLICFEANDNYINIFFIDSKQQLQKRLERMSMKKVEELLNHSDSSFLRVHKSYVVNKLFIKEIKGKSQAYRILLEHLDFEIPVSRRLQIHDYLS
jgi:DNA-binding LytR/AlgR family response regulator